MQAAAVEQMQEKKRRGGSDEERRKRKKRKEKVVKRAREEAAMGSSTVFLGLSSDRVSLSMRRNFTTLATSALWTSLFTLRVSGFMLLLRQLLQTTPVPREDALSRLSPEGPGHLAGLLRLRQWKALHRHALPMCGACIRALPHWDTPLLTRCPIYSA